ncbi:hypothetical protein [Archangium violaceum]|uniref:Uncharacterized protein n=1 Tax=Archangium violaceum Cb vi76 TaxID=1406225 RepID=A0A084SFR7_9BACT|nr:hypothetical protein [Archangium violaceum]KFA87302.1 hypothetical protein Q664_48550 [Archangium violaceum Cb vi76]
MESPVPGGPRVAARKKLVLAMAALGALSVAGGAFFALGILGGGGSSGDPSLANEARVNVLRLCGDVQSYRDEHGVFLQGGPVPREVPRGGRAVRFEPDENLKRIGFSPGERIHYQYQVVVQETPLGEAEVTCYARGDLDGDGQVSVFSVTLDANGMTSAVKVERETE